MILPANEKRPSERQIGCRIRVRPENADEAAKLFEQGGFRPIYVEHRADGDISFWFGKAPDDELYRIFTSIPREFYAIQGAVVRDHHPFSPTRGNGS
jgi:hypothetical protein